MPHTVVGQLTLTEGSVLIRACGGSGPLLREEGERGEGGVSVSMMSPLRNRNSDLFALQCRTHTHTHTHTLQCWIKEYTPFTRVIKKKPYH